MATILDEEIKELSSLKLIERQNKLINLWKQLDTKVNLCDTPS